ncbi:hypothetical protein PHLCEN_2v107 [Hermanssonia centrifuga]|uniref:Uncharacterized protein n=1 Tax=Hermanssonia centrifuga TaxID=98765 RepID=A0A2R6S6Y9_9APHY|nr:hypothetical protein PHLCEN_2v107 [Hermanssonia centrifuga]
MSARQGVSTSDIAWKSSTNLSTVSYFFETEYKGSSPSRMEQGRHDARIA